MTPLLKRFLHIAQVSLFFSSCKACEEPLVYSSEYIICRECRAQIAFDPGPKCRICGRTVPNGYHRCGECILAAPPFRKHISYSRYRGLLKDLILMYKYSGIEKLKLLFADYYVELFSNNLEGSFDCIIPVPPDRARNREFEPILEISRILARRLGLRLFSHHLIKVKETLPQAGLSRAKRVKNLDGAFRLRNPGEMKQKRVLLIDDVYTTGTTIQKCARLLSKHGAEVAALTLARS